uniref:FANCD2 opposite strand n=1 Tax=Pipistrellus kuhlii TaxID=59472 RepID=A0A7J7WCV3_PIPKU|nr:FANCD2 opposite strand [Pipistrellus kuhlii]
MRRGPATVTLERMAVEFSRLSMAGYQLWSPWTPLDESFQWLRHTTPTPSSKHPFRASPCFPHTPSDLEVQLCFQEVTLVLDSPFLESGGHHGSASKVDWHLQSFRQVSLLQNHQPGAPVAHWT